MHPVDSLCMPFIVHDHNHYHLSSLTLLTFSLTFLLAFSLCHHACYKPFSFVVDYQLFGSIDVTLFLNTRYRSSGPPIDFHHFRPHLCP